MPLLCTTLKRRRPRHDRLCRNTCEKENGANFFEFPEKVSSANWHSPTTERKERRMPGILLGPSAARAPYTRRNRRWYANDILYTVCIRLMSQLKAFHQFVAAVERCIATLFRKTATFAALAMALAMADGPATFFGISNQIKGNGGPSCAVSR